MSSLQDRVARVTGSSRSIGATIASLFANEGARVVVHGRDSNAVESVRSQIEATGGQVMSFIADLTRYQEIEAMREQIEHLRGPVDILVANAGRVPTRPAALEEMKRRGLAGSGRYQPDRDIPDDQVLPQRNEGTSTRKRHHHLIGGRAPPTPRLPNRLRRRQSRHRTPHQRR